MGSFALVTCGANTKYAILMVAAYISAVGNFLLINVFSDSQLSSQVCLSFTRSSNM